MPSRRRWLLPRQEARKRNRGTPPADHMDSTETKDMKDLPPYPPKWQREVVVETNKMSRSDRRAGSGHEAGNTIINIEDKNLLFPPPRLHRRSTPKLLMRSERLM